MLCLKSIGNEICSRFKSYPPTRWREGRGRGEKMQNSIWVMLVWVAARRIGRVQHQASAIDTFSFAFLNFPRRFIGVGVLCVIIIFNSRPNNSISRASSSCSRFCRFSSSWRCFNCFSFSSSSLQRNSCSNKIKFLFENYFSRICGRWVRQAFRSAPSRSITKRRVKKN